jgi:hypothetical protein
MGFRTQHKNDFTNLIELVAVSIIVAANKVTLSLRVARQRAIWRSARVCVAGSGKELAENAVGWALTGAAKAV